MRVVAGRSTRHSLTCWAFRPGGVSRIATRSAMSSQWAIIASCTPLHAFGVDHAPLVGGHQVGHAQHRDLVDRLEAGEAGAVGRVADVVVGRDADVGAGAEPPPPASVDLALRRHGRALPPLTSSRAISFDSALTFVATLFVPRLVVTLSKTSSAPWPPCGRSA